MLRRIALCVPLTVGLVSASALSAPASPPVGPPADPPARAAVEEPSKPATQQGHGGAVSSVDPYASAIGIEVLARGGNAVDAAVATAAALGVTEPYSAGVGGGGYFVYYDAESGEVRTLDGRETAPMSMPHYAFIDPETGKPYNFTPELVTSGVSVGVPGTPMTWTTALRKWGTRSLAAALRPAARLARTGFEVDATFRKQTEDNRLRFEQFWSTRALFLPGGEPPSVGSTFKNPQLARTYEQFGARGTRYFYRGAVPADIVRTVRKPPTVPEATLPVPPGFMTRDDLRRYDVLAKAPTKVAYRGHDVYGMAGSSSGGTAVGEALNILEGSDLSSMDDAEALHRYLESTALAFADRATYVGDDEFVDVPRDDLLSQQYADERACRIDPAQALTKPTAAGDVTAYDGECDAPAASGEVADDTENESTTHLTVADKWGNVVAYTLTIEQTGGSGIVVPGRGFLLNNELTDFSTVYNSTDPNRIEGGKRPRSSMSPTIVVKDGEPMLALGSPGGSTIITTVLQLLLNRLDFGMTLPEAVAAPRASQRNTARVTAEQAFIDTYGAALEALGHDLVPAGDGLTSDPFIGAAAAIELGPAGLLTAAAEPVRRGGGAARVVKPLP
ncbi:MAG: gamma-glutamyltransferase [Actinomycetota bacterium]|nr:gamma-glutamyltransferase [Actinomycetota bacterium]